MGSEAPTWLFFCVFDELGGHRGIKLILDLALSALLPFLFLDEVTTDWMFGFLSQEWWHALSFFGDSALTVPGALVLALWLAANGRWRMMLRWLCAFGGAMMIVVVSKLLFMGWHIVPPWLPNFTGVSGHSASAMCFYLGLGLLLSEGKSGTERAVTVSGAVLLAVTVGLSRLAIKVHSPSEVITGLALGALAGAWFWLGLHGPAEVLRRRFVLVAFAAFMLAGSDARPAPTQQLLQQIALWLSGHERVYTRSEPL